MASVQHDKNGYFIQFVGPDKRRHKIRLGKTTERNAERFAEKLEQLITCAKHGTPLEDDVRAWTLKLGDDIAEKFAAYGLMQKRESVVLGKLIDDYLTQRTDIKPQSIVILRQTQKSMLAFFGDNRDVRTITPGDADAFRSYCIRPKPKMVNGQPIGEPGEGLAETTVRRRIGFARQFLRVAIRKKIISDNPFADVKGGAKSNKDRMYFVTREETAKVLAACPDAETRLTFALARFGGLRTPSEHRGLRWVDVNWAENKFLVHSPKTERHEGGASRWVPIFPELRPYLEEVFHDPDGGREFVISRHRGNLRDKFTTIIKRAGLTPWPKIFQNLRSTRETELMDDHKIHVVCAWIGNSPKVAMEHYLQVTDADFAKAAQRGGAGGANVVQSGAIQSDLGRSLETVSSQNERSNAQTEHHEGFRSGALNRGKTGDSEKRGALVEPFAGSGGADCRTDSVANSPSSRKPGTTAAGIVDDHLAADLALVVNAWPNLSPATRAAVLELIDRQAAAGGEAVAP